LHLGMTGMIQARPLFLRCSRSKPSGGRSRGKNPLGTGVETRTCQPTSGHHLASSRQAAPNKHYVSLLIGFSLLFTLKKPRLSPPTKSRFWMRVVSLASDSYSLPAPNLRFLNLDSILFFRCLRCTSSRPGCSSARVLSRHCCWIRVLAQGWGTGSLVCVTLSS
jgi:hypothetical protein